MSGWREKLYPHLPVRMQNWAVSFQGWRFKGQRFNHEFARLLEQYRDRSSWTRGRICERRDAKLSAFVSGATRSVPHYEGLFADAGLEAGGVRRLDDLRSLPVIDKQTVQSSIAELTSARIPASAAFTAHTSGTTGAGLRFPMTWGSHREQWAVWWRYREWHGLHLNTKCLLFSGRPIVPPSQRKPPFWRYNRPGRQVIFSGYHLGPDTAPHYLEEMRRAAAPWIHGYPSMAALIASYAIQNGADLPVRWVTVGAENLLPQQAAVIEEAFGVTPLQHYGAAEGVANISQCPAGKLHVDEDFSAVEFLPTDTKHEYRLVGTNFTNPAFPLIRYDTGDIVTITGAVCHCRRPGRVVDRIDGRREDYVITKRGSRLGRLDHIFKDMTNIREAQIHQLRPGHMKIIVVRGSGYREVDETALKKEVVGFVGDDVDFDIDYADSLSRTSAGKLRFVLSSLSEGALGSVGSGQE